MDIGKNFAKAEVSTGYNSAATSVVLTTGHGAKLPAVPFSAVWWNSTDYPDPSDDPNVEIVRVTAKATDTLTVTRAQQGTSASNKNTSSKLYKMLVGLTAREWEMNRTLYANGAPLWRAKHVNVIKANFAFQTGENDLYTCPAGRKAIVQTFFGYNVSGTSPNVIPKLKVSGSYYRLAATTALTSGTGTTIRMTNSALNAGESFSLNFSTGISANGIVKILEFDDTSPLYFARSFNITSGPNTIYTCPAGYSAVAMAGLDFSGAGSTATGTLLYANDSGGATSIDLHVVPSGGSASGDNILVNNQTGSSAAVTAVAPPFALAAGDFCVIDSTSATAGQHVFGIFFESPLPE